MKTTKTPETSFKLRKARRDKWITAKGQEIPQDVVPDLDRKQEWVVMEGMKRAQKLQSLITETKTFVRLAVALYLNELARMKGLDGNTWPESTGATLFNYDKTERIVLAFEEKVQYNNEIQLAKPCVDDFIEHYPGFKTDIQDPAKVMEMQRFKELVKEWFKVNKQGLINLKGLHTLLRTDFDDPNWKKAQDHVRRGIESGESVAYYIFEKKDPATGDWKPISLNFSRY